MDIFEALADPQRRKVIELLAKYPQMTASAIYRQFDISPSAVSQHLKVLLDFKFVTRHKQAQQRIYELDVKKLSQVQNWLKSIQQKAR